jgi:hypothetical protein
MEVKDLVEGYCQVTGRPTFTITVDEYIKFHQLAMLNQPRMERYTIPTKEVEVQKAHEISLEQSEKVPVDVTQKVDTPQKALEEPFFSRESGNIVEKTLPIQVKPTSTKKEPPKKVDNMQVALAMLKSIQG